MSKLDAFLHPIQTEDTREVVISKRFVDKDGKPVPFKIRSITQEENNGIIKACTRRSKNRDGGAYETFDKLAYNMRLVLACVLEPDFSNAELCSAYSTMDPMEVPSKMLFSGEYAALVQAIMDVNGFGEDAAGEAKNS